jgi:hypothetical protein
MGGLGYSEVSSAWGIPSPSYIKSSGLHTTTVHMNDLVLFKRYSSSLDTLELSILIAFLFFITIGKVCMLKFEMSLLGVNNVIE